jgi:hypothetical protein
MRQRSCAGLSGLIVATLLPMSPVAAATPPAAAATTVAPAAITKPATPDQIWSLRAALNVAALRCTWNPAFNSIDLYNGFVRQFDGELSKAHSTMIAERRKVHGKGAMAVFDRFNTRLYNSMSNILEVQDFCDSASRVAQRALALPVASELRGFAGGALSEIKGADEARKAALAPPKPRATPAKKKPRPRKKRS